MTETKRLTGIFESVKGFVGAKVIVRGTTKEGRSRIFFDLYAGWEDKNKGTLPIIRHCIVYGDAADNLKNIIKGSYVEVSGFLIHASLEDKQGDNCGITKEERLISEKAQHVLKEVYQKDRQLPLGSETLAPVGQA